MVAFGLAHPELALAGPAPPNPVASPAAAPAAAAFSVDEVALAGGMTSPQFTAARVRIELLATESRTALNGQSADLLLDADCDGRRTRLRKVTVYPAPHQAGSGALASAPPDWLPFSAHSYAAQIAEAICARRGELAAAASPDGDPPSPRPHPPASADHVAPGAAGAPPRTPPPVSPEPVSSPPMSPGPAATQPRPSPSLWRPTIRPPRRHRPAAW